MKVWNVLRPALTAPAFYGLALLFGMFGIISVTHQGDGLERRGSQSKARANIFILFTCVFKWVRYKQVLMVI